MGFINIRNRSSSLIGSRFRSLGSVESFLSSETLSSLSNSQRTLGVVSDFGAASGFCEFIMRK